ncbi:MAG: hypothetical protein HC890_06175 [Chloroflexaceae bacterium]|nr:hypothetical protein [Chloroflexaceae bacterium]
MNNPQKQPPSLRSDFKQTLQLGWQSLSRPLLMGSAIAAGVGVAAFLAWQYAQHPEWLGTGTSATNSLPKDDTLSPIATPDTGENPRDLETFLQQLEQNPVSPTTLPASPDKPGKSGKQSEETTRAIAS